MGTKSLMPLREKTGDEHVPWEISVTLGSCDVSGHEIFNDLLCILLRAHCKTCLPFAELLSLTARPAPG